MKRLFGRLQLNNKGTSLIELIIALVVLVIVFLPMYRIFVQTAKMNRRNAELNNAETVAENVMEAVKLYGLEGTKQQVNDYLGITPTPDPDATPEPTPDPDATPEPTPDPDVTITPPALVTSCMGYEVSDVLILTGAPDGYTDAEKENFYSYELQGVTEGDETYTVTVTMDSNYKVAGEGETVKDVNTVELMDFSAINADSTAFINPMAAGVYYDDRAIGEFTMLHELYKQRQLGAAAQAITDRNNQKYNEWWEANKNKPLSERESEPTYETVPSISDAAYRPFSPAEIESTAPISREVTLTITEDTLGFLVNSDIRYTMEKGSSSEYLDSDTTLTLGGYCSNINYKELDTVYLLYIPFKYLTEAGVTNLLNPTKITFNSAKEKINIQNNSNHDLKVYIVVQTGEDLTSSNCEGSIGVTYSSATGKTIDIYSQATLEGVTAGSQSIIVKETGHSNRIVNVTVSVSDSKGEVLKTMTSTISK